MPSKDAQLDKAQESALQRELEIRDKLVHFADKSNPRALAEAYVDYVHRQSNITTNLPLDHKGSGITEMVVQDMGKIERMAEQSEDMVDIANILNTHIIEWVHKFKGIDKFGSKPNPWTHRLGGTFVNILARTLVS